MKRIHVAAAVICNDLEHKRAVFATQRGYGPQKGFWEFPGGKIEAGEGPREALVREIQEELRTTVEAGGEIGTVEWDYPGFHLTMTCFWCRIVQGALTLTEAMDGRWLTAENLRSVDWLPADEAILDRIAGALEPKEGEP